MLRSVGMKRALALAATALLGTSGCFTDATQEGGGTGDPACVEGSVTCPCYPNDTCDASLVCFEGVKVCVPDNCNPLVAGCPCPAAGCGEGLVCEGPVCVASGPGTGSGSSSSGSSGSLDSGSSTSNTTVDSSSTGNPSGATSVTLYFSSSEMPFSSGAGPKASRVEVQNLCEMSRSSVSDSCVQSAALFSTSDSDSVLDLPTTAGMPFSVPVHSTDGTVMADSLESLLVDGSAMSLLNWGVSLPGTEGEVPEFFWCGSQANGANGSNCSGWTVTDEGINGKGGSPTLSGQPLFWLSSNDYPCNASAPVLCACWD